MARTTDSNTIVVIDDEMHNMIWMLDYIESKSKKYLTANSVDDAIELLSKEIYRAIIVDLNIPISENTKGAASALGDVYLRFPGLYVAYFARNRGYRDRQVIIYSVHRDPTVSEESSKLGCTYILKGRPKEIKEELDMVVSFDPTE